MVQEHKPSQITADGWNRLRRRWVRQHLAVDAILSALAGLMTFAIMPPANAVWPVWVQAAIAAAVTLVLFVVSFVLLIFPQRLVARQ